MFFKNRYRFLWKCVVFDIPTRYKVRKNTPIDLTCSISNTAILSQIKIISRYKNLKRI